MFGRTGIMQSTGNYSDEIKRLKKAIEETDAVVIGAGMAGILIASALSEKGVPTIVVDAGRIASGQTCNTTAKITSQHGPIYSSLITAFGDDKAAIYAKSNELAINRFADAKLLKTSDFSK